MGWGSLKNVFSRPHIYSILFSVLFLGKSGDFVDVIDNAEGHVGDLALHLDHIVEDQVGQHRQGVGPDLDILLALFWAVIKNCVDR